MRITINFNEDGSRPTAPNPGKLAAMARKAQLVFTFKILTQVNKVLLAALAPPNNLDALFTSWKQLKICVHPPAYASALDTSHLVNEHFLHRCLSLGM